MKHYMVTAAVFGWNCKISVLTCVLSKCFINEDVCIDSFLFKFELQESKIFPSDCPRSRIARRQLWTLLRNQYTEFGRERQILVKEFLLKLLGN